MLRTTALFLLSFIITVATSAQRRAELSWKSTETDILDHLPMIPARLYFQPDTAIWTFRPQLNDWVHKTEAAILEIRPHYGFDDFLDDGHKSLVEKDKGWNYHLVDYQQKGLARWHQFLLHRIRPGSLGPNSTTRLLNCKYQTVNGRETLWGEWDYHNLKEESKDAYAQQAMLVGWKASPFNQAFELTLRYFRDDRNKFQGVLQALAAGVHMEGRLPQADDAFWNADSIVLYQHKELKGWTSYSPFAYESKDYPVLWDKAGRLNESIIKRRVTLDSSDYGALSFAAYSGTSFGKWSNPCFYPQLTVAFYKMGKPFQSCHLSFGCRRILVTDKPGDTQTRARERTPDNGQWRVLEKLVRGYGMQPDIL